MNMSLPLTYTLTAALTGITAHIVFCHFEPSMHFIISLYLASTIGLPFLLNIGPTIFLQTIFSTSMLCSIAIYRLFFHRCCQFPGPTLDILSKWTVLPLQYKRQLYRQRLDLLDRYGDVVRVGPREIIINDSTAIEDVYGSRSYLARGNTILITNLSMKERTSSLLAENRKLAHKQRRMLWNKSFAAHSLRTYQMPMLAKTQELMTQLAKQADLPAHDIAFDHWAELFTFDIIGQLGFKRDFHMVAKTTHTEEVRQANRFLWAGACMSHVYYLGLFLVKIGFPSPIATHAAWCADAMQERLKLFRGERSKDALDEAEFCDIFGYILQSEEDDSSSYKHTREEFASDALILVTAGSETTSTALSMLVFELTKQPAWTQRIRDELERVFDKEEVSECSDFDKLAKECPVLNACINETLRLWPPVPMGFPRETSKDAPLCVRLRNNRTMVIPKNTVVNIPILALHRDPRNFNPTPDQFRPDRWLLPEKEKVFTPSAFMPFGHGPRGCIGKQFAYQEMRALLSLFLMRFDFAFAPSFDERAFVHGLGEAVGLTRSSPLLLRLRTRAKIDLR